MTTRDGTSTILLYPSGVFFDPIHPDPEKIHVEDIAHALSLIPRFGGHTPEPYSVAQHSVLVSQWIEANPPLSAMGVLQTLQQQRRALPLWGLLHEVAEALSGFGDVCAPVKRVPHVAAVVKPIEKAIEAAAAKRWCFPDGFASADIVKQADRLLLDWEERDLRVEGHPPHLGFDVIDPGRRSDEEVCTGPSLPEEGLVPWPWQEAKRRFLERYEELRVR